MSEASDTNEAIWKSDGIVADWAAKASERDRERSPHWRVMSELLPFDADDDFLFLDLGAGTGAAARTVLTMYPSCSAVLADFSPQMMEEGERALEGFAGRFRYVEFDMHSGTWPEAIPTALDAVVTSLCIHHMPDERKQGLFREIYEHLIPGGWYLNYDAVTSGNEIVAAAWQHTADRRDPDAATKREHRTAAEQARWENHVRYMIPLEPQLEYLRAASFEGIDVYWKNLENVIYGGRRRL